jgi:hypothetical protein
MTSCDYVFMQPLSATSLTILEFNSASISTSDLEKLDINFPLYSDGIVAGPAAGAAAIGGVNLGAGATANVIPFGPVNLAIPSIAQTTDSTIQYQRAYFFSDTF